MAGFELEGPPMLVGLSGTRGAGKDAAADYLRDEYGYIKTTLSDVLRHEANIRGLGTDRDTLADIARQLSEEYGGAGGICVSAVEQWAAQQRSYMSGLVICGIRVLGQAHEIINQHGRLLYVDAPLQTRFRRITGRNRGDDAYENAEALRASEQVEMNGTKGLEYPNLLGCMALAHAIIENTGDLDMFHGQIDSALGLGR